MSARADTYPLSYYASPFEVGNKPILRETFEEAREKVQALASKSGWYKDLIFQPVPNDLHPIRLIREAVISSLYLHISDKIAIVFQCMNHVVAAVPPKNWTVE